MICFVKKYILLLLIFLFWFLSFEKDGVTFNSWKLNLNEVLSESLFSNTKTTWTKEFSDSIVNFKALGNFIAVSFGTREESNIYFKNFERDKEWILSGKEFPYYDYFLVGGDTIRLMQRDVEYESCSEVRVFSRVKELLWKVRTSVCFMPSPNGIFYYSGSDQAEGAPLEAFNNEGKLLWTVMNRWGCTDVEALGDSTVVFVDGNELFLYDLTSGRQMWTDTSLGRQCWELATARNGKDFIVFDTDRIYSLNRFEELKWTRNDMGVVYYGAISVDGAFVAVQARKDKDNTKSIIALLDNKKKGKTLWITEIDEQGKSSNLRDVLLFRRDYIQLMPDAADYFYRTGITEDMKTYICKINRKNGKLISSHVLPGNVQLIEENGEVTGYYQLQVISGKKILTRVEAVP